MACCIASRVSGTLIDNCSARVGKNRLELLRSECLREKKKLAARIPSSAHASATVCEMADFPDPAGPSSQHTDWSSSVCAQLDRTSNRVLRVPGRHFGAGSRSLLL